jgi:competence protein ComEC
MDDVINTFEIGSIYMPKVTHDTKTFEDLLNAIKNKNLKVTTAKAGTEINIDSSMQIDMLAPNLDYYEDLNDYSDVLKLTYQNASFLLTGDAGATSEGEMLVSSRFSPKADVLKVGHHGSSYSTSPDFLSIVSPKYAVISVGKDNKYGHPAPSTIKKLFDAGIKVYRTDELGTITVGTDGEGYVFNKKPSVLNNFEASTSSPISNNNTTQTPISETVYITESGSKYHKEGCKYLSSSKIPINREEAINKGFQACGVCKP